MTKIKCPCAECVHNGNHSICKAKEIKLTWRNMATVNEGRVDMWVCNQYEASKEAVELSEHFVKFMKGYLKRREK